MSPITAWVGKPGISVRSQLARLELKCGFHLWTKEKTVNTTVADRPITPNVPINKCIMQLHAVFNANKYFCISTFNHSTRRNIPSREYCRQCCPSDNLRPETRTLAAGGPDPSSLSKPQRGSPVLRLWGPGIRLSSPPPPAPAPSPSFQASYFFANFAGYFRQIATLDLRWRHGVESRPESGRLGNGNQVAAAIPGAAHFLPLTDGHLSGEMQRKPCKTGKIWP